MSTPLNSAGYASLRALATGEDGWTQLAIIDSTDALAKVIHIPSHNSVAWTDPGQNPVTAQGDVSLQGVADGAEITGTALYRDPVDVSAGDPLSETSPVHDDLWDESVIVDPEDTLTVSHVIELPTQS